MRMPLLVTLALCWSLPVMGDELTSASVPASQSTELIHSEIELPRTQSFVNRDGLEWLDQPPLAYTPVVPNLRPNSGPTFRLRGRIDADAIGVNQSDSNKAAIGDVSDVVGLRRARIGAEGKFSSNSRYVAEIDLASRQVIMKDVFAGFGDLERTGEFKWGHMREPFSLEGGTSANTFAFTERSPSSVLDPARNWGIGYARYVPDEDYTYAFGLFKSGADPNDFGVGNGSDSAATAKWTRLLWYEDDGKSLMHVGMAASSRFPDNQFLVINQRPRSSVLDLGDSSSESPFVSKIRIPATFEQRFNAQWASVSGPFWIQAEWNGSLIDQRDGPCLFYHGGYLAAGHFIAGGSRSYQKQNGIFGPVTVTRPLLDGFSSQAGSKWRGHGAWELTARLSYLDLFDSNTPNSSRGQPVGAMLPQATIGINWYLADRLRIMFNFYHDVIDEPNVGVSTANLFTSRLAMFW